MESWPTSLPQIPHGNDSHDQQSGLLVPEEELGQIRTRTYPEYMATFTFANITAAQFQLFRLWWDVNLNRCLPFIAPWLEAAGYSHHFCRFSAEEPWVLGSGKRLFDLTITVEIIAGVPVDGGGAIMYGRDGWL